MGLTSPNNLDHERHKRALRAEIARLRRRINRSWHDVEIETRRLADWRTYVRRYSGLATGAALATGFLLASRWRRSADQPARGMGMTLAAFVWRLAYPGLLRGAIRLVAEILSAPSVPGGPPRAPSSSSDTAQESVPFERPRRRAAGMGP